MFKEIRVSVSLDFYMYIYRGNSVWIVLFIKRRILDVILIFLVLFLLLVEVNMVY